HAGQRKAYPHTFERVGQPTVICQADAGAMGGSRSVEVLHRTEVGEDAFVVSDGGYSANVEAVITAAPAPLEQAEIDALPPMHVEDTPGASTIAKLTEFSNRAFPGHGPVTETGERTRYELLKHPLDKLTHPPGAQE